MSEIQVCEVCGEEITPELLCEEAECPTGVELDHSKPLDFTKDVQTVHIPEYVPEYDVKD